MIRSDRPDAGVVVAEASGVGWSLQTVEYSTLIPLRPPSERADGIIRTLLAGNRVPLEGVLRVCRSVGLADHETKGALARADAVLTSGAGHLGPWCHLPATIAVDGEDEVLTSARVIQRRLDAIAARLEGR